MLPHLLFLINSVAFLCGGSLFVILFILYKKYGASLILKYSVFHLSLTFQVLYFVLLSYLSVTVPNSSYFLLLLDNLLGAFLMFSIAYFFAPFLNIRNSKNIVGFFTMLSIGYFLMYLLFDLALYFSLIEISSYHIFLSLFDYFLLLPVLFFVYHIYRSIYNDKLSSELTKYLKSGFVIIVLFIPGFFIDLSWFYFKATYQLIPSRFYFMSLFYLVWNVFIMYCSKDYLLNKADFNITFEQQCKRFQLSGREQEICRLLCIGDTNQLIAEKLFIEESTVKKHLQNIFRKVNVSSRFQLVQLLQNVRLVDV